MGIRLPSVFSVLTMLSLAIGVTTNAMAQTASDACLVEAMATADDSTTVGELRVLCQREQDAQMSQASDVPVYELSAFEERFAIESEAEDRPFIITPHQPNFILWSAVDSPNQAPFADPLGIQEPLDDTEMVFQVSIKAPIWRGIFDSNVDAYFGYTVRSWWQLFNDDLSAPFRETNYQPELFLRSIADYNFLGMKVNGWDLGFNHESNGRGDPLTRSWNRIIGRTGLQLTDNINIVARAWYRLPEDDIDDENPNEYKYYGYGDVRAVWTPNRNTFSAMVRPGTDETSYELTWSYPISNVFRIYAQYFNGYGESLLDYDYEMERFSIGIAMNDFLGRN
ncbi:MAG: phospholipase A [Woeseiaceae bacterium]